jgi:hypothetical protein
MELLLDTLCNVFGGIILIACLLAMLSRPKVSPNSTPVATPSDREAGILMEKRIEMAQAELDGLQKLRAQLQSEDDPSLRPLITQLEALKKTAELKQQEKARQEERATLMATQAVQDISREVARLREQEQEIERKLGIANKDLEAARQRQDAARKKLADLQLELESVADLKVEKLRLPRERASNKITFPFILKHGQIFPLFDGSGKPTTIVRQVAAADGSFTALVNEGQGLSPHLHVQPLRELLRQVIASDRYVTLYVYPDSYGTMRVLKKLILEMKIEYGLELCTEHRVLVFDPKGAKPAAL